MATAKQLSFDATKPFYAWVGVGDLALARVRAVAGDFTSQLAGQVTSRMEELARESRDAQTRTESRIAELQAEALAVPRAAQTRVEEVQAEVKALVDRFEARVRELRDQLTAASREQLEAYDRLAARGETVVGRAKETEGD